MCFQINKRAIRPRNRIAYKVVFLTRAGYLQSATGGQFTGKAHYWSTPGATIKRSKGKTESSSAWGGSGRYAKHGIYVFGTLERARRNCWNDIARG